MPPRATRLLARLALGASLAGSRAVFAAGGDDAPAPASTPDTPQEATQDDAKAPSEIHVVGDRREVGGTAMKREAAREIPGTFGDPSRFVETMPGVVPTSSGLQSFYVRGAPPETTGYYLDGIPVPALYHIGFGPSVVHPGLMDRVEFFPGAAPAYFGREIGGVIAGDTSEPAPRTRGEANLRLLDASGLVETPVADGRGSVEASGRYGYPALVVPLFAPDVGLSFWDYQTRATWNVTDHDRLGVFVFGSRDRLTQNETNEAGVPYTAQLVYTEFHRLDLRYDHLVRPGVTLRVAGTLGYDSSGDEVANIHSTSARLRAELDARLSRTVHVRAGADAQVTHLSLGPSPLQPADPTPVPPGIPATPRDDVVMGMHADLAWRIAPHVELVPGLRADVFTSHALDLPGGAPSAVSATTPTTPAIDPRLAARVTVAPRVTVVSTVGVSHQAPGLTVFVPDATPYIRPPGVQRGIQRSDQLSEGMEVLLPGSITASSSVFLHHYANLPDLTGACTLTPSGCIAQNVDGRAYGLELLVRRPLSERLAVLVSYTLSRAMRQAHPYDPQAPLEWIPSEYDRTHVGSAVVTYDFGSGWRAGARFLGYTGRPYTHTYEEVPVPPFNTERLAGFWRLDLRIEKTWSLGGSARLSFVAEGLNVTLNKEVVDVACTPRAVVNAPPYTGGGLPTGAAYDVCTPQTLGPITIPSVGLEGAF